VAVRSMEYRVERVALEEQPTAVVGGLVPQEGISDFLPVGPAVSFGWAQSWPASCAACSSRLR
jgi:hypothetical protein